MMLYTSEDIDEIVRNVVSWNTEGLILIGMLHDDYLKIRSKYKKPAAPYRLVTLQKILPDTLTSVLTMKRVDT